MVAGLHVVSGSRQKFQGKAVDGRDRTVSCSRPLPFLFYLWGSRCCEMTENLSPPHPRGGHLALSLSLQHVLSPFPHVISFHLFTSDGNG